MDPHEAGPSIQTVLSSQPMHHSSLLWDAPLEGEVESQLRIMAKCELGSEIYTDCIKALEFVEEIDWLTLDDARDAGNTSEPAVGCGRQVSGHQGRGGRQFSQHPTSTQRQRPTPVPTSSQRPTSGQRHTPVPSSSQRPTSSRLPTSSQRPTSSRRHTLVPHLVGATHLCMTTP
ncbi:hypothetical protein CFP56_017708 [Quercus suber]|uniref:Uncharacterized protein n=1 Tax=Quercus suber TaxID=58331 RepID=A0AAW0M3W1_QUESU